MLLRLDEWVKFAIAILVPQGASAIGALITAPKLSTWYGKLEWPAAVPPDWAFGPVWTFLFLLMGVAAFLIWRQGLHDGRVRMALAAFLIQLGLNVLWSFFFFGLENPALAFAEIIALLLAIGATIFLFFRVSRPAAYLLVPYIAWVTFAAYLNFQIWMLN